ncbi:hypothetical protein Scel_85800 [Streptomyces cellostaticus]|nr:hypothetical protein [Streptomyces cellostaticus]GHI10259.1 hypothetical protein Scel_85800 [Streptomyces cellostaticus]
MVGEDQTDPSQAAFTQVAQELGPKYAAVTSLVGEVLATTQQQLFPKEILARVSSLDWMISLIAMPAGYAAAPVARFLGMRTTLLAVAALIGTPCLLLNLLPGVRSVQRFSLPRPGPVQRAGALAKAKAQGCCGVRREQPVRPALLHWAGDRRRTGGEHRDQQAVPT